MQWVISHGVYDLQDSTDLLHAMKTKQLPHSAGS